MYRVQHTQNEIRMVSSITKLCRESSRVVLSKVMSTLRQTSILEEQKRPECHAGR